MSLVCRSPIFPTIFPVRKYASLKKRSFDLSLYLVTERTCVKNENDFLYKAERAIKGGVTCLQLRDRNENLQASIQTAHRLKKLMENSGVPLLINNRVDVALAVNADGVHLGQKDFPYHEARRLLGEKSIIGITVETLDDVRAAEDLDIDYLGVQLFPSINTKPNSPSWWGIDGIRKIKEISRHRLVAIGGVTLDNLESINTVLDLMKEKDGVAMVGQLWRSDDPYFFAEKVRAYLERNTNPKT